MGWRLSTEVKENPESVNPGIRSLNLLRSFITCSSSGEILGGKFDFLSDFDSVLQILYKVLILSFPVVMRTLMNTFVILYIFLTRFLEVIHLGEELE